MMKQSYLYNIRLAIASAVFPLLSANSVLYITNSILYSPPKRSAKPVPSCCPHPQALDRAFVSQFDFKPVRTHVLSHCAISSMRLHSEHK
jgi:hypothetical protein